MWFAALLRRFTVRNVLASAVLGYIAVCYWTSMPLLSSALPEYTGKYDVGLIDVEVPCEKRRFSEAILTETGKPAFELDTVFFSVFYPAVKDQVPKKPQHSWVTKPLSLRAEGYARFANINNAVTNNLFALGLWATVGSTEIPAKPDVAIHGSVPGRYIHPDSQYPLDQYGLPKFPVIVFSHGMASSRTDYTHYCGELASRGYICAMVEHRDGSGPGSFVMSEDGSLEPRFNIKEGSLNPEPSTEELKQVQLAMRQAEVEETVRVLRAINDGKGREVFKANLRDEGAELVAWRDRLNMQRVVSAGHSYGATLALQTLKGGPIETRPFVGAVILDPGKSSGPLNDDIHVPIMVIHSNSWSAKRSIFFGQPHFDTVKNLVQKAADTTHKFAWFMTCKGTTHPSVTDAPLIEPFLLSWTTGATIDVVEGVMQYVKATDHFMYYLETGHRRGLLKEVPTHPEYDNDIRDEGRRKAMDDHPDYKHWQIHIAPSIMCPSIGLCGDEPG